MALFDVIPLMRALDGETRTIKKLAADLTIPLSETQKRLTTLRDIYGATKQNAAGDWQLTFAPQWLDINFLSSALTDFSIVIKNETPSTNALAKRAKPDSVFLAEHQTNGRGRYGRKWCTMPGGAIAASVRIAAPPSASGLSLAIGAALWRALGGEKNNLRLKWPNDLMNAHGEKIGGILIDATNSDIIAGAGINLVMTSQLQNHIARPAAALTAKSRNECAAKVCRTIAKTCAVFAREGLAAFLPDARTAHFVQSGEDLQFHSGNEEVRGAFAGFAEDGALLIRQHGGIRAYISGEIHVAGS